MRRLVSSFLVLPRPYWPPLLRLPDSIVRVTTVNRSQRFVGLAINMCQQAGGKWLGGGGYRH